LNYFAAASYFGRRDLGKCGRHNDAGARDAETWIAID
jgi:hypothetical protein